MLTDIALDAMGSDKAPDPEIRGAILACRHFSVRVSLIGPEALLRPRLQQALAQHPFSSRLPIDIVHADEYITMDEKAAHAVRSKKNSSMRVGLKLVKEKRAAGFFTAGNTGAAMATAKMVLGALPGVDRPALAVVMPTLSGSPCVLLDVGANVDCKPQNLDQFAVMGELYARSVLRVPRPRVGILSVGEEESKGNDLTREAWALIQKLPINFIGNAEGRDIYSGNCDVIVCDGFVGNVVLKMGEGFVSDFQKVLKDALLGGGVIARIGAALVYPALRKMRARFNYETYGGAPLLGLRGNCIVTHGRATRNAVKHAIHAASIEVQNDVIGKITELVKPHLAKEA